MAAKHKKIVTKAFAMAQGDTIMLDHIEPFTNEGRKDLLRAMNRPAGQRVITIIIREQD